MLQAGKMINPQDADMKKFSVTGAALKIYTTT